MARTLVQRHCSTPNWTKQTGPLVCVGLVYASVDLTTLDNTSLSQVAPQLSPKEPFNVLSVLADAKGRMKECMSLLILMEKERGLRNMAPLEFCRWLADVLQNKASVVVDEETSLATFECFQFSKKQSTVLAGCLIVICRVCRLCV